MSVFNAATSACTKGVQWLRALQLLDRMEGCERAGLGWDRIGGIWGNQASCAFFIVAELSLEAESSISLYHQNGMPSARQIDLARILIFFVRVGHPCGVRMFCPCATASDPHELKVVEAEAVGPEQVVVENKNFTYSDDTLIEFITDVEGHWEYFLRVAHCSKVLYWDDEERGDWGPGILRLRSNGMLVFGGDAPDKGPGDIRLVKTLISLKKRFPKQADSFKKKFRTTRGCQIN